MKNAELYKCILGSVYTNCYFLKNKATGEVLIVDPADEAEKIFEKLKEISGTPKAILLTHGHFDHIQAVEEVRQKYHIPVYAQREEEKMLLDSSLNLSGNCGRIVCSIEADTFLSDLEVFEAAGFSVQIIHTPGHTEGSCLLLYRRRKYSVQRRYSVLRFGRKNGSAGRQYGRNCEKPPQTCGFSSGGDRGLSGT